MNNVYEYYLFNNSVYIRLDCRTHNYQFLNSKKMWEDHNNLKNIVEKSGKCNKVTDERLINTLNSFLNNIPANIPLISQEDFDRMSDIDKLKTISQMAKKTNHLFDNSKLK